MGVFGDGRVIPTGHWSTNKRVYPGTILLGYDVN